MTFPPFCAPHPCDPIRLFSRMTNLVVTTQTQLAYACLEDAKRQAGSQIDQIATTWPESPARILVTSALETQRASANALEHQLLALARERGGLAFARI